MASFSTLAFADLFTPKWTQLDQVGAIEGCGLYWELYLTGENAKFETVSNGTKVTGATKIEIQCWNDGVNFSDDFGIDAYTEVSGLKVVISIGGDEIGSYALESQNTAWYTYPKADGKSGNVFITIDNPTGAEVLLSSITCTIITELPKVTVTPGPGTYDEPQDVVLTCGTGNSFAMYYTLDGSDPNPMFGGTYTWNGEGKKIHIAKSCTLKVVVFDNTGSTERTGDVEEFYYTINAKVAPEAPTANIKGNTYKQAVTVTLSQQFGAKIIYTIDGTEPVIRGKNTLEYEGSILIDKTTTLKFRAVDEENNLMSEVVTEEYIIEILTAVDNAAVNFSVYAQDGAVVVETEEADALIEVFSVTGQRVAALRSVSDVTVIDGVDAGVAIVRVNGKACKVVVR